MERKTNALIQSAFARADPRGAKLAEILPVDFSPVINVRHKEGRDHAKFLYPLQLIPSQQLGMNQNGMNLLSRKFLFYLLIASDILFTSRIPIAMRKDLHMIPECLTDRRFCLLITEGAIAAVSVLCSLIGRPQPCRPALR